MFLETYSPNHAGMWSGSEPRYPACKRRVRYRKGSGNGETRADFAQFGVRVISVFRLVYRAEASMWLLSRRLLHHRCSSSISRVMPIFGHAPGIWSRFRCFRAETLQTGQSCEEQRFWPAAKCFTRVQQTVDPRQQFSSRDPVCKTAAP